MSLSSAERASLLNQCRDIEEALERYQLWRRQRAQEEARARAQTAKGIKKADALSARLAFLRLKLLKDQPQQQSPST